MNRWIVFLLGYGAFLLGCFEHRLNIGGRMKKFLARLLFTLAVIVTAAPVMAQTTPFETLALYRQQYPVVMSDAQLAELLNRVAWVYRAEGMKLLGKAGGRNCPLPSGLRISCDYLVHSPSLSGHDVFTDNGTADIPPTRNGVLVGFTWGPGPEDLSGAIADHSRTLVDPERPDDSTTPVPTPTPTPTPGPAPPPAANQTLSEILQHAITIEQVVADLQARNARIEGMVINHESQEAIERAKAEAFRQAVGHEYAKFFGFVGKYIAPAVATALATWKLKS